MKIALIIPAYKPASELLALLKQFEGDADYLPVVVDDGSGAEFAPIFDALPDTAILLRHEVNRGKGAALKTAIQYVLDSLPDCALALTADADGQHRYEDILKVVQAAAARPGALVLGSRAFDGEVPLRSRFGNGMTRQVFAIASGRRIRDTQTGLRAFDRDAMRRFVQVKGERYEYEINMLLDAAQSGMPIYEETIQTVYLDDNSSSHFNPLRDSFKIYLCILKFCFSSLLAAGIDYLLVLLISALTQSLDPETSLDISVVGARVISATINFFINRRAVFKGDEKLSLAITKYALLAVVILLANWMLMQLFTLTLGWPIGWGKLVVEIILFPLSFIIQGRFVYRSKKK